MTRNIISYLMLAPMIAACARDGRPDPAQPGPPGAPSQSSQMSGMQGGQGGMQGGQMRGGMHGGQMHGGQMKGMQGRGMQGMQGGAAFTEYIDPGARDARPVREAIATLSPTQGSNVTGTVRFVDTGEGSLDVVAEVDNLPNGVHAFHVHVYGDCSSPDAKSAGPHFHFTGSSLDKSVKMITGNLGELTPEQSGKVTQRARIQFAQLHGPFSIIGRSVVVHEKGNDPKVTPDGGAGGRIACGVIGVAMPSEGEGGPATATSAQR